MERFPTNVSSKTGMPISLLLFSNVLKFYLEQLGNIKKSKSIQIGKKEVKLYLFSDTMIPHIENPKEYIHQNLLKLVHNSVKFQV